MLANNLLKNNQVLSYYVLTFIISWGAILCIVGPNGLPAASEEAKQAVGSGLLIGPSMATFIMTAMLEGREGFRELLFRRIHLHKIGDSSYIMSLLIAPLSSVVALMLSTFFSEANWPKLFTPSLAITGISVGLVIATFEEIGWSGYAVPRLLQTHDPTLTGVLSGLVWGLWHFPLFWEVDTFSSQIPLLLLLGRLFTWIVAFRVVMVLLYARTKSLTLMILIHASLVFCMIAMEPHLQGSDLLKYILSWSVVLWLVVWIGTSCISYTETMHDEADPST
jgi:membrane protease YdiL (CAAX protease family)